MLVPCIASLHSPPLLVMTCPPPSSAAWAPQAPGWARRPRTTPGAAARPPPVAQVQKHASAPARCYQTVLCRISRQALYHTRLPRALFFCLHTAKLECFFFCTPSGMISVCLFSVTARPGAPHAPGTRVHSRPGGTRSSSSSWAGCVSTGLPRVVVVHHLDARARVAPVASRDALPGARHEQDTAGRAALEGGRAARPRAVLVPGPA